MSSKFKVSFVIDAGALPVVMKTLLPIGLYEFEIDEYEPPSKKKANGSVGRPKNPPNGLSAKVIRRVFAHLPNKTGTRADCTKAFERAGLGPSQGNTFRDLVRAGQLKRIGPGQYKLVGEG